jgi:6-phosphogluconolactonase (cycloisomerase 2 family)
MPPLTVARRDFLGQLAGLTTVVAAPSLIAQPARSTSPRFMYVGSFTGEGRGRGEGISVFQRKGEGDAWALVQLFKDVADPSFLKIDRSGRFLYSAHGAGTQATSYAIEQTTGRLTLLNQQPAGGINGVHLDIDATGRFLALANYATGTVVVLPINQDGTLAPHSALVTLTGEPGPHRTQQTSSHPHHCPFDRTGRYIVVPDKGFDKVFVYRLDAQRGTLVEGTPPSVASRSGAAPRHADFHPTRPWAYVINELDSTMTTYQFEPDKGVLKPIQVITTLPPSYTGNNSTAEVWVAPSGRFVYGSNRGHDSIVIFAIDQATGELTPVGWESTQGRTPRFFGLDPSGSYLYAANQNSDTVVIFRVDQATGRLSATKEVVKVVSPSTIVFR